ncbi:MAG: class I SAM-dependent methyltransferase, partial [Pseudomonadota bacterium]
LWNAAEYEATARFVSDLGAPVLDLLAPIRGERILDLGCGDGALTAKILEAGAEVIGLDASRDMVAAARARGVDARVSDGHSFELGETFDAVFSNAALHWMTEPDRVLSAVARHLEPGGRFVAEQGGHGNVAAIRTALIAVLERYGCRTDLKDVWYFPGVDEQRARLDAAGFDVTEIGLIPRPTRVAAGVGAWLDVLAAPAMAKLDQDVRARAILDIETLLRPALCDSQGHWTADYVRLRFRAVKR